MRQYHWIDLKALKILHERSISIHGGSRGIRDEGLLESAMDRPKNLAHYGENIDLADLAASYAFGLAKNHAFVDGNKRASFLSIGLFLGMNGYRLTATPVDAIQVILAVASSSMQEQELASWIRSNMAVL